MKLPERIRVSSETTDTKMRVSRKYDEAPSDIKIGKEEVFFLDFSSKLYVPMAYYFKSANRKSSIYFKGANRTRIKSFNLGKRGRQQTAYTRTRQNLPAAERGKRTSANAKAAKPSSDYVSPPITVAGGGLSYTRSSSGFPRMFNNLLIISFLRLLRFH